MTTTSTDISREAYAKNRPKAPAQRAEILEYIGTRGVDGATCDEAEMALNLAHQTCSARFKDLKDDNAIEPSGEVRKTRTGCRAMVYVVAGPRQLSLFEAV